MPEKNTSSGSRLKPWAMIVCAVCYCFPNYISGQHQLDILPGNTWPQLKGHIQPESVPRRLELCRSELHIKHHYRTRELLVLFNASQILPVPSDYDL